MKKIIFGIFAHPDDEAFGPAGTLLREAKSGSDIYLICLTSGQNGQNPDNLTNLSEVRLQEWHKAGKLLGATSMHHLGFTDGELNNKSMLEVVDIIEQIVRQVVLDRSSSLEIEFISMDTNGITGHIDHIIASRATHMIYYRLKKEGLPVSCLRLVCLPREYTGDEPNVSFVYMEPGRQQNEINQVVDNSQFAEEVIQIMKCHYTQRDDCQAHLDRLGDTVAIDYFIVKR